MKQCVQTNPPVSECNTTKIFGVPKGRRGRFLPDDPDNEIPISGIVIHCLEDSYDGYISKACKASPSLMPCGHASMHYVIDAIDGRVSCLVKEKDVAWAFQSYLSNFPLPNPDQPYPGWPELRAQFPAISADFYTINIGITNGTRPENDTDDECCIGPYGMIYEAYQKLIKLISYLAEKYDIPINAQHIALHDDIVETKMGCEECRCRIGCLVCDVSGYCEGCVNVADNTFTVSTQIDFIYGEYMGCKVKISLENLMELLNV